jgi:flagellar biogenesis protein FliO
MSLPSCALAQSSQPAATQTASVEQQSIRRSDASNPRNSGTTPKLMQPATGLDVQRVLMALAIVIGLILVLWALARWLFPGVAAGRSWSAVRVLARSVVSPKQQILLVQVGRRVIAVGDSGTQMSPLCEMRDADEIAEIMAQLQSEKQPGARAFRSLFGRARDKFVEQDVPAPSAPSDAGAAPPDLGFAHAQEELGGLIERVRGLAQQFKKST